MQNINAIAPRNDLTAVSSPSLQAPSAPTPAPTNRLADEYASTSSQDEAFTVVISPEAAARGAVQEVSAETAGRSADPQGQQPDTSSAPGREPALSRDSAAKGEQNATNTEAGSNQSRQSVAEQRSNRREEQAERQIVNTQTIRNYANASLKTQINGGRLLDEEV